MKERTNHASTSVKLDERKLLLKMASKGLRDYKELCRSLGLSENTFRVGFYQNQGYFSKRVYAGLCLLFGCTVDDLTMDPVDEIPVQEDKEDISEIMRSIFEELKSIRKILEVMG